MAFLEAHEVYMKEHLAVRERERERRLLEGRGYGPHWRNVSRIQFSDHCRRQNDLVIDGWKVLRFSYTMSKIAPATASRKSSNFSSAGSVRTRLGRRRIAGKGGRPTVYADRPSFNAGGGRPAYGVR